SVVCGESKGRAFHGCGWTRVRGFVPGRYWCDDRAFAGPGGGCTCAQGARRHHADASDGRFAVGWRRAETAIRLAVLAICVDGDGCEPVCDSHRARDYAGAEDSRLHLLLSRDVR